MSVYHGRPDVTVSQHLLNGADIVVSLQQMGCETMPKGVGRRPLQYLCLSHSPPYCLIHMGLMEMIPPVFTLIGDKRSRLGRKEPLPDQILSDFFILLC